MRSRNRNNFENYGNVYFITSTVVGFIRIFDITHLPEVLINAFKFYQSRGGFKIMAYVIMPNHFHLVIKVNDSKTISDCIGNLKRYMAKQIISTLENLNRNDIIELLVGAAKNEPTKDSKVWKYRFDCLTIISEDTLRQKIEYIHNNPVRAQITDEPMNWKYSSAANYLGLADTILDVDTEWSSINFGG
jgi:putative transposase